MWHATAETMISKIGQLASEGHDLSSEQERGTRIAGTVSLAAQSFEECGHAPAIG